MWVRFWYAQRSGHSHPDPQYSHVWFDELSSKDCMDDEAESRIPDWARMTERGVDYGWDVMTTLPADVRRRMTDQFEREKAWAEKMLEILAVAATIES